MSGPQAGLFLLWDSPDRNIQPRRKEKEVGRVSDKGVGCEDASLRFKMGKTRYFRDGGSGASTGGEVRFFEGSTVRSVAGFTLESHPLTSLPFRRL